jgi:hypothetical protein
MTNTQPNSTNNETSVLLENLKSTKGFGSTVQKHKKNTLPDEATSVTAPQVEEVDWKKRHDDGRAYINELQTKLKELETKVVTPVEVTEPKLVLPKSEEEVDEWKQSNPEIYDQVLTIVKKETQLTTKELEEAKQELKAMRDKEANAKLFREVVSVHNDADEIRQSAEWVEWFNEQTPLVRSLVESSNSRDVIRGIDLFKKDTGFGNTFQRASNVSPSKSAEAAGTFQVGNSRMAPASDVKIWTMTEINKLSTRDYAALRDQISLARKEGRVQMV